MGWFILAASSLPLHLFYNSAIFAQTHATLYHVYVVDPAFVRGAPFNVSEITYEPSSHQPHLQSLQSNTSGLANLSVTECIEAYSQQLLTKRGDLLAVTVASGTTPNNILYKILTYDDDDVDQFNG